MIIYFAGNGVTNENSEVVINLQKDNWGILLSYKEIKTKKGDGNLRYKKLMKRIK